MKLLAALVLAGAAGGAAVYFLRDRPKPIDTVRPYLELWKQGRFDEMRALVARPPAEFTALHRKVSEELMSEGLDIRLGRLTETDDRATATFVARQKLRGLGEWTYRGRLTLRPGEERWLVEWGPGNIHPDLGAGQSLERTRSWPPRAAILASDGTQLAGGGEGVVVGMQPNRVKDPAQLSSALQANLGSDPANVLQLLQRGKARPDQFVALTEISEERYGQVRAAIYDIPGLVFQRKDLRVPPTEAFARQTIGRVGEITKEGLEELGEPYLPGDKVGRFGLEAALERQLAGRPSGEVKIVDEKGSTTKVLHRFPGEPSRPAKTTLDMAIQRAADTTLEGSDKPSAIVAIDSLSGQIRGVANYPINGYNRAVAGRYPPGSTFKVVTTSALLASGIKVEQPVSCPSQTEAGGRTFRNFEGHSLGEIDFRTAFEESCNTAFVDLVRSLEDQRLLSAAETFGFGANYALPIDTAGGSFPPPKDLTERVAAAIGQARVTASPLHMASVAAAAASGAWRTPDLIIEEGGEESVPEVRQLDPAVSAVLQRLMRGVVQEGTGERAAIPRREVAGKTGTAEFGTAKPPRTHAWFIGFSGPLAFAVLVEDGGVGGETAAPLAAKFLSLLPPAGPG